MRAWLERVSPPGERIALPDESGRLIFGRGPHATLVFDGAQIAQQHLELAWDAGFWRLRDLGSAHGTQLNGAPLSDRRALFQGDLVRFGEVVLRFCTDLATRDGETARALRRAPEDEMLWRVHADALQERGDPLGERIAQAMAGQRVDHQPWLGPLWEPFVAGQLEIGWRFGFIHHVHLRTVAGRTTPGWQTALPTLFNLPVGGFVHTLSLDLPRLEGTGGVSPQQLTLAQRFIANLPGLPDTLEQLSLGYELNEGGASATGASAELAARLPRLRDTTVFERAPALRLRVLHLEKSARLSGIEESRVLTGGTRIRRGERGTLFIEAAPGIPLLAEGNPCHFSVANGGLVLFAGRMRGEVRVNQRVDASYPLMPDDVLDVHGAARFRLELAR